VGYRVVLAWTGAWVLVALASHGCGASNGGGGSADGGYGGSGGGASVDGSLPQDAATTDVAPPAPSCGTLPPSGRQIVASKNVAVGGVTSDGYAIYTDTVSGMTYATLVAGGGAPIPVGMVNRDDSLLYVSGHVVYIATRAGTGKTIGSLSVWTAASGASTLSTGAYVALADEAWFASVSSDGSYIAYLDGATTASATLTLATTDGKTKIPLVANVALQGGCDPSVHFGGASFVASYCIAAAQDAGAPPGGGLEAGAPDAQAMDASDAGPPPAGPSDAAAADAQSADGSPTDSGARGAVATVASFTSPTFAMVPIATNVNPGVAIDAAGSQVLVSSPMGLWAYPVAGGPRTQIDATGTGGVFTKDGKSVLYTTSASALKRLRIGSAPPIALVASGLSVIRALSPDDNWVLASNKTMGNYHDLYVASATAPGMATALATMATSALFGDAFTADSGYALFFTNVMSDGTGDFYAGASTGAPTKVTANAWQEYATAGSGGLVNDNYNAGGGTSGNGIADIEVFDATNPTVLKTLVTAADADFYPTATKDAIVYSWTCAPSASAGLWVLAVR